ncbi:MAG TPA: PRC-barrel domain-containing protein [Myxococcota bacterium]|nr:PRC-barrel domain-containing protein [Myxococcota bacterium]
MNIPINAKVECTDGSCGRSTNVVVNPVNRTVTHVAIEDKSLPDNPTRLVPVADVAGVTDDTIRLNCARTDVANLGPFVVADFVQQSPSGGAYSSGDAYSAQYVVDDTAYDEVHEEEIPEGELGLYGGMHVEASDGRVGKLDELVLDSKSGAITGLVMRRGHLWGSRDVTVPVDQIEFTDGDTVYLKLDKLAVGTLPAMKVRRG